MSELFERVPDGLRLSIPKEIKFVYFEHTEGGMDIHDPFTDPSRLYGWMSKGCTVDDHALVQWMTYAKPGDIFFHRLGALVCANAS